MKNLIVYAPNPLDATSLYRAHGPFSALRRRVPDLLISEGTQFDWRIMKSADAIFLQRPAMDSHVATINLARVNRCPTWVDYDDDLHAVTFSNPTFGLYGKPKIQNNVVEIMAKAHAVSVSTPVLAEKFKQTLESFKFAEQKDPMWILNPDKIHVVPNAYDEELLVPLDPRFPRQPNKLVCWRGSATHQADMAIHKDAFCRAWAKHLDWTINFVGSPFWQFIEAVDNIPGIAPERNVMTETLDPINYFDFLRLVQPALMIVPLEDSPFNRAKSNITWLEGLHAGAISLAPDFEEWRRPGVINYSSPQDFGDKLDAFLSGKYDHRKMWCEGAAYVNEHLLLTRVNGKRQVILQHLFEQGMRK